LAAAHLIGIGASLAWTIAGCTGILLIGNHCFGEIEPLRNHVGLDKIEHTIAVCVLIFLVNWQAQHYFQLQNRRLAELGDSLLDKAIAMEKLADFDTLTGLFNRHSFHRQIRISLIEAREAGTKFALLLLDLDGFKEINDTQGHQVGDLILKEVAERLRQEVKKDNLVARLGGDEFTIIIENAQSSVKVAKIGNRIKKRLAEPYHLIGKQFLLDSSIGASIYPTHSQSIEELVAFADTAMYRAKVTNGSTRVYHSQMTQDLVQRRELEQRLMSAQESNEFQLFYQPQIDLQANRVSGCEALLRWQRDGQWIPPGRFISSLESTREICTVGKWILREACQRARVWNDMGHAINVSVNVSPVQFRESGFLDNVFDALEKSGLAPENLDLEVTESILIADVDSTEDKLDVLREIGVSVSIDDFGTGYSSLAYLKRLPLTRLKIDRAFIKDYPLTDDGMIADTIISLSHNLRLKVLAEGVESIEQLNFLRDRGCDEIQGFVFSKPLPADEFESLLKSTKTLQFPMQESSPLESA
jgi:diguanylate cyclase (GGDEF)-like protein